MNAYESYLKLAETAAREAGAFLREQLHHPPVVDESLAHDIKLRVDKDTQALIAARLLGEAPETSLLGEEGCCGASAELQWVVDPLDGTVNYYYGIPIFCTSIALHAGGVPVLGCVYDPMQDECYTALRGGQACCNERRIGVSSRARMSEAVVFVGHGSHDGSGEAGVRRFAAVSQQVRKMRILGSAALSLCYIAAGRLDAYVESRICLWDFAAARVILEAAGGRLEFTPSTADGLRGAVCAWNNHLPLHDVLAGL
ncbi:MAG: inositol monophosphatase family protein [Akkermansia sp.]